MSPPSRSLAGARFARFLRGGEGGSVGGVGPRPSMPLELYEFEACPFCRRVREAATRLDLELLVWPCPKRGTRFRARLLELGGKEQFPFLVDPHLGRALYESADIVAHLEANYGSHAPERRSWLRSTPALVASGLARGRAGSLARPSRAPVEPLVLEGFEADPESRLVREILCELELAYCNRPMARGSMRRVEPAAASPALPFRPRLVDPNTGQTREGYGAIADYLESTYALAR